MFIVALRCRSFIRAFRFPFCCFFAEAASLWMSTIYFWLARLSFASVRFFAIQIISRQTLFLFAFFVASLTACLGAFCFLLCSCTLTQLVPLSSHSRCSIVLGLDEAETRRRRCVFQTRRVGPLLLSALNICQILGEEERSVRVRVIINYKA